MASAEIEELKSTLGQFRLDLLNALAAIDVEIDALRQAVEEGETVKPERLKELRSASRMRLGRFLNYHAEHVSLPF